MVAKSHCVSHRLRQGRKKQLEYNRVQELSSYIPPMIPISSGVLSDIGIFIHHCIPSDTQHARNKSIVPSHMEKIALLMILTVAVAKVLLLLSFWSKFHCWMPSSFLSVVCFQTQQKPCERCTEKCLNVLPQSCTKKFKIC